MVVPQVACLWPCGKCSQPRLQPPPLHHGESHSQLSAPIQCKYCGQPADDGRASRHRELPMAINTTPTNSKCPSVKWRALAAVTDSLYAVPWTNQSVAGLCSVSPLLAGAGNEAGTSSQW